MLAILAIALIIIVPCLLMGISACMLSSRISRELEEMNEAKTYESEQNVDSYAAA